ncbi:MAG: hypothetical protein Q8L51_03410 [Candidatus Amesbacteria bacterium]|nr:hypothetical protein [Candidatus Amesbacteria bacterium]
MKLLAQLSLPENALGGKDSAIFKALCGTTDPKCLGATTGKLITLWLPNALVLAGIIFFFLIIGAGWQVIMGAGSEASAQDKAKAQAALTYAIIGFLLIVSAYFILQIIGVITGINFLTPLI